MEDVIKAFLLTGYGSGYGYGYGDGYGSGYGDGDGSGSGYGSGSGDGDGSGYGYCSGYGYGDGYGSGYGYGDGYGSGYGYGYGDGYGSGYGDGSGSGYGYGSGSGDGDGYGSGYGYGSGSGSGDGYGYGYEIKSINGQQVYQIDDTPTILHRIIGNVAKGAILQGDLSLTPCTIVKHGGVFAHGSTFQEAQSALNDKLFDEMGDEDKIQMFRDEFKRGVKYPASKFYDWHGKLTGSCKAGRDAWVKDHGINLAGTLTVDEFITLTEKAYGRDIIARLKDAL